MFYIILGIIISVNGFITGIAVGSQLHSFLVCLYIWGGTFLFAVIYIGIGHIVRNQNVLMKQIVATKRSVRENIGLNETIKHDINAISGEAPVEEKPERKEETLITCPVCGTKQKSTRKVCWSCGTKFTSEQ